MKRLPKKEHKTPMRLISVRARVEILRDAFVSENQNVDAIISRAIRDRSPKVRATAAELIAKRKNASFLDSLHELLSDPSDLVRGEAIDALGVIEEGSGRHYENLVSRLHDVKRIVRIAAIETLTLLRDFRSVSEIESCLGDDDPLVRAYAAIALAELVGSTYLAQISNALAAEKDEAAAAGLMVAMRILQDETKFTTLLSLLSSRKYQVRCFVANWLPRLNLSSKELEAANVKIEEALSHPLGRADGSTMLSVREQLQSTRATTK